MERARGATRSDACPPSVECPRRIPSSEEPGSMHSRRRAHSRRPLRPAAVARATLFVACGLSSACGWYTRSEARAREQVLLTAGFATEPADTPAQRARLSSLPLERIVEQANPDGSTSYVLGDAANCC